MKTKYLACATLLGALALLAFTPVSAIAGGKGSGSIGGGSLPSTDDVGTGPRQAQGSTLSVGFVIQGKGLEILQVLQGRRGSGTYEMRLAGSGTYEVTFKGENWIRIPVRSVESGKIAFGYAGKRREDARVVRRHQDLILIQG